MALTSGTRLGTYEVRALVGAGGMGEVYAAHDSKLDRDVAIKVLPAQFVQDPERLARFQREAKLLASLNHPNIATIHGLEQSGSTHYLVMELVPGDTLRERVAGGRAIPVEEALVIARQIAEALEAAHGSEKGIIHRDLKPANVKVTPEGRVKVLDFGLAKAFAVEQSSEDFGNSPTLSAAPTMQGVIMGTAAYMSPEQARGKAVTKATDIFAFGAVLYELLTGKQAFQGEDIGDILATVVKTEPDWNLLPANTPPSIRTLLKRCLRKDRRQRLQDAATLRIEIEDAIAGGGAEGIGPATAGPAPIGRLAFPGKLAGVLAVALAAALAMLSFVHFREAPAATAAEMDLDITTPPTADPVSFAISPDGRRVVFSATTEGHAQLWVRSLDVIAPQPLAGTDNATLPFWSPDSRSIGFFAEAKLKRIDIAGGSVQALADAPSGRGGTWNRDGTILYAPSAVSPIYRIAATGGKPAELTKVEKPAQSDHRAPQFLPDGQHFLYYARGTPEGRGVYVGQLDGGHSPRLLDADAAAVYAASGHLLFVRQGTLFAERFDVGSLALVGDPFPVAQQVIVNGGISLAALSTSQAGPIIYRAGTTEQKQLVWTDRSGKVGELVGDADSPLTAPVLSPDGRRVAIGRNVGGNWDVWLIDIARGVRTRLTSDPALDSSPAWSPDGSRIVFMSARNGKLGLYTKLLTGTGGEDLLLENPNAPTPMDWSSDGRFLLYRSQNPATGYDLWALPMGGDGKPFPVAQATFNEREGQFSPDGKWVAYQSDESGRTEIYVQPFPGPGEKTQVSTTGGAQARWRADGKELFYIALDGRLMSVPMQLAANGRTLDEGRPVPLFETHIGVILQESVRTQYAVARDGQRFLMNTSPDDTPPIRVILNWAGLKK